MMYPKPKDIEATIFINGQFCIWDDDPEISFGQVWMPVCIWCKRGPLSSWDGLTCEDCRPKHVILDDLTGIWNAMRKGMLEDYDG